MTNEELEKLANLIADKVVYKIEQKQQEWDEEFISNINTSSNVSFHYNFIDEKEILSQQLKEYKDKYEKALTDENYLDAKKFHDKIIEIKNKINKLNNK